MNSQNIKVYLAISGALIVLLILIIIIPFSSKKTTNKEPSNTNQVPFPTSIETGSTGVNNSTSSTNSALTPIPADFTGALDEKIPQQVIDLAAQKKDLRSKVPLDFSTFTIDFNYSEDKFIVSLKDPRDQAQKEFESWRTINYPGLGVEQFILK